jgi:NhaP-type Na+/H+ or K+/H+ antiporter
MNDGSAFPFVMLGMGLLGLHELGETGMRWVLLDVLWATLAGIAVGVVCGILLARLVWKIRGERQSREMMDDFLGLGLIGIVYGLSVLIDAWGFLAVFFAAVALHQTELKLAGSVKDDSAIPPIPPSNLALPESETSPTPEIQNIPPVEPPALVSVGSLVFKEHLERLSEVLLILLVGGMLFIDSWSWPAVGFAVFLFVVVRPLSVLLGMVGSGTPWRMRGLIGWFGVRGIGSLYYLMYVIQHGLPQPLALQFIQLTLVVVTLSILAHGASVKPLLNLFWRRKHLH